MPLISKKVVFMEFAARLTSANGAAFLVEPIVGDGVAGKDVDWSVWFHSKKLAGTNPTSDCKVQHSPNGTVWVDLVSATQVTTVDTVERKEVTGTIGPYFRAVFTIGGTDAPSYDIKVELCSTEPFKATEQA